MITADDQQGLQLDSLEVKIPHAEIAGIGVDKVDFRYRHGDDSLRGEATLDSQAAKSPPGSLLFTAASRKATSSGAQATGPASTSAGRSPSS